MKNPMDLARSSRSESGFALIEVIVSAVVLALMALAILSGIDGAAASSSREKARAVASSLAEADQERLRAVPVATLAQYAASSPYIVPDPAGATKTVDGVGYTVTSKAEWVRDDTGDAVTCASSGGADYFHITSTVTSTIIGKRTAPVTIDSIYAPNVAWSSTRGTLAVQVLDAKGNPVVGKLVTITGGTPPAPTLTNSLGCAVFQELPVAAAGTTYTATLNSVGYIDPSGQNPSKQDAIVTPGALTLLSMSYDVAATVTATVQTYPPGGTPATHGAAIASAAPQISAVTSGATGKLFAFPSSTGTDAAGFSATNLFPFPQKYTFFTGYCHYNDPTDTIYGSTNTASPNGTLIAGQQVPAPGSATIIQPPLNYQLTGPDKNNTSPPANQMTVFLRPVIPSGDQCVQPSITLSTFNISTTSTKKWAVGRSYNVTTRVLDAGVPFGKYTVCFKDSSGANTRYWTSGVTYDNTTPPTGPATTITGTPTSSSKWTSTAC